MKSIFPAAIDSDLLKLVHLSNGFHMVDGARLLADGDVCKAEAHIISVINASEGKFVKVKGFVYRQGQCVIEVVSSFLYRGRFSDYENTFDTTEEPDYVISIQSDVDVGQTRTWASFSPRSGSSGRTSPRRLLLACPLFSASSRRCHSRIGLHTAMFQSLEIFSSRTS